MLALLALTLTNPSLRAAPLFPDIPDHHWARDAVAALAAKGLLEGYPDGTFKGDRAASRWETALLVARLLAKMEQGHASFATSAELEELRKLVNALRQELDALGVRVQSLEEGVDGLNQRVTELERISFYGYLETRIVSQSFHNDGANDNDANRGGAGAPGTVPYLNYHALVGTRTAAPFRPQVQGIIPTVDYRNGRGLTNGTGFTALAVLGVKAWLTPQMEAGMELAGYTSQGDSVVDAYWGVSAPYLSNPFTANAGGLQPLSDAPFTRMTMDRFWLTYKNGDHGKLRLMIGNIDKTEMDSFVFLGEPNIGVFGPKRWPGYGFQVLGDWRLGDDERSRLSYEVLGTRWGPGVRFEGTYYQNTSLSGNVAYHHNNGKVQLNYSRLAEEAPTGGGPLVTGLTNGMNTAFGASAGWTQRQWVNPPGYYLAQLPPSVAANIGYIGNTADTRPIPGWTNLADNAVGFGAGGGNYGPQSQQSYGISAQQRFAWGREEAVSLGAEAGRSQYRSNRNSPYSAEGTLLRAYLEGTLFEKNLALGAEFLRVDPTYNPAAWSGNVTGIRFVDNFNFTGVFHLHDHNKYPHNREGFRANANYRFCQGAGVLSGRLARLRQTETSLYNVRVTPGALGPGAPNTAVLGFAPGWVDPVFYGFAHPSQYGPASANSFTSGLAPLENPRGYQNEWELGAQYTFSGPGLKLSANYRHYDYRRDSVLSAALGGSQNRVKIDTDSWLFDLAWDASEAVTVSAGLDLVSARGHYDPAGLYNGYAVATDSTTFSNIDSKQIIPHIGVDWQVTDTTEVNFSARYYDTRDNVDPSIGTGSAALGQIGATAHPFDWSGLQLMTHMKLSF